MEKAKCIHKLSSDSSGAPLHFIQIWKLLGIPMVLNGCCFSQSGKKLPLHFPLFLMQQFLRLQNHQVCTICITDHGQLLEKKFFFTAWEKNKSEENCERISLSCCSLGAVLLNCPCRNKGV